MTKRKSDAKTPEVKKDLEVPEDAVGARRALRFAAEKYRLIEAEQMLRSAQAYNELRSWCRRYADVEELATMRAAIAKMT